eukprot:Platyproteum_vivax@DN14281_c0_g1_i1.p1
MIDIWDGPPREGVRGGQEHFKWNDIKEQAYRDRECYLGYSTKVGTTGKFGRFYKNDWWQRSRENAVKINQEKEEVKNFEDELMQEALGLKPKKLLLMKSQLSEEQKEELLKRPQVTENDQNDDERQGITSKGLGYLPHRKHEFVAPIEKLEGTGIDLTKTEDDEMYLGVKKEEAGEVRVKLEPQSDSSGDESTGIDRHGREEKRKRKKEKKERKALKKIRKLEKKAKKAMKNKNDDPSEAQGDRIGNTRKTDLERGETRGFGEDVDLEQRGGRRRQYSRNKHGDRDTEERDRRRDRSRDRSRERSTDRRRGSDRRMEQRSPSSLSRPKR